MIRKLNVNRRNNLSKKLYKYKNNPFYLIRDNSVTKNFKNILIFFKRFCGKL